MAHLGGIHGPVPNSHFIHEAIKIGHAPAGIGSDHPSRASGTERPNTHGGSFLRAIHIESHLPIVPGYDSHVIPLSGFGEGRPRYRPHRSVMGDVLEFSRRIHPDLVGEG